LVRGELSLKARKTAKTLLLPIVSPLQMHLENLPSTDDLHGYLHTRAAKIFMRINRSASLSGMFCELLQRAGLREIRPGKVAGIHRASHGLSFHSLRHTMVSLLKDAGVAQAVVQEMAGHASAKMSALYTHVGREALEKAAATFPTL